MPLEEEKLGYRGLQRPRKLTLTIPAIPREFEEAGVTHFLASVKGVLAGLDAWKNILTVPSPRAHASLGVPLPKRPEVEDACQRRIGVFIALAHILVGGYTPDALSYLPATLRAAAKDLTPKQIASSLW